MPLTEDELHLAENCYGYGRWSADYWFIGLDERLSPWEHNDRSPRAKAFRKLNKDGLCDCAAFHAEIGEKAWQSDLQFTWGRLIWLLKKYLNDSDASCAALLDYQEHRWGTATGDTCVTELSGLPADSSEVGKKFDKERFRDCQDQLKEIKARRVVELHRRVVHNQPQLVVMYGKTQKQHWPVIAGIRLELDVPARAVGGRTLFLYTTHPNARGRTTKEWDDVADSLSREFRG